MAALEPDKLIWAREMFVKSNSKELLYDLIHTNSFIV
jgi:hypothetical protein